jgi:hypothetical protein
MFVYDTEELDLIRRTSRVAIGVSKIPYDNILLVS